MSSKCDENYDQDEKAVKKYEINRQMLTNPSPMLTNPSPMLRKCYCEGRMHNLVSAQFGLPNFAKHRNEYSVGRNTNPSPMLRKRYCEGRMHNLISAHFGPPNLVKHRNEYSVGRNTFGVRQGVCDPK